MCRVCSLPVSIFCFHPPHRLVKHTSFLTLIFDNCRNRRGPNLQTTWLLIIILYCYYYAAITSYCHYAVIMPLLLILLMYTDITTDAAIAVILLLHITRHFSSMFIITLNDT